MSSRVTVCLLADKGRPHLIKPIMNSSRVAERATKLGKERAMCTRMSDHPQWFDTIATAGILWRDTRVAEEKLWVSPSICGRQLGPSWMWMKPRQNRQARQASLPQKGTKSVSLMAWQILLTSRHIV